MKCEVCGYGPQNGVSVYRVNPKGKIGLWACSAHKHQFDYYVPDDICRKVELLEKGAIK